MSILERNILVQKAKQLWLTLTVGRFAAIHITHWHTTYLLTGLLQHHHLLVYEDSHRAEASSSGLVMIQRH